MLPNCFTSCSTPSSIEDVCTVLKKNMKLEKKNESSTSLCVLHASKTFRACKNETELFSTDVVVSKAKPSHEINSCFGSTFRNYFPEPLNHIPQTFPLSSFSTRMSFHNVFFFGGATKYVWAPARISLWNMEAWHRCDSLLGGWAPEGYCFEWIWTNASGRVHPIGQISFGARQRISRRKPLG